MEKEYDFDNMSIDDFEKIENEVLNDTEPKNEESEITDSNTIEDETENVEEEAEENFEQTNEVEALQNQDDTIDTSGTENAEDSVTVQENVENSDETLEPSTEENQQQSENTENIPEEYKKAKEFYDALSQAEFNAGGVKTKVMMDPDKIVQMHQYGVGFHKKMQEFNKYKPYLQPLQESGILEDQDKFNLIIEVAKGNKDAVKKLIKDQGIDPVMDIGTEDDLVDFNYQPDNHTIDPSKMVIDESIEQAKQLSSQAGDKLVDVLVEKFDDKSMDAYIKDSNLRNDMINHVADGTYDMVVQKIAQIEAYDMTGQFTNAPFVNKYANAYETLANELASQQHVNTQRQNIENVVKPELQKQDEYQREVALKEAQIDEQRKKVAQGTRKTRNTSTAKSNEFNPLDATPGEFDKFLDDFLAGRTTLDGVK